MKVPFITRASRFVSSRRHDLPAVKDKVVSFAKDAKEAAAKGWEEGKKQSKD